MSYRFDVEQKRNRGNTSDIIWLVGVSGLLYLFIYFLLIDLHLLFVAVLSFKIVVPIIMVVDVLVLVYDLFGSDFFWLLSNFVVVVQCIAIVVLQVADFGFDFPSLDLQVLRFRCCDCTVVCSFTFFIVHTLYQNIPLLNILGEGGLAEQD